jgi:16S rRNA (adenine1518-N6/adenine1519-N6)-dimethyltransferase
VFRLLELHRDARAFRDATIMLQREVADRIAARPGSKVYGVLSIAVQMEADVTGLLSLPPGAFRPAPEVFSSVVRLTFRPPAVDLADRQVFDGMVRAVFTHRRKTLANALKGPAHALGLEPADVLRAAGVAPGRRPETLDLPELAAIANHLAAGRSPSVV